jgi:hypothetical protein
LVSIFKRGIASESAEKSGDWDFAI